ncbi:molybdenum cofactor guanylyltransferase [Rubellicoccus peritrichatus]|uniref:Probable molybdenum cofactor guanylyltransferase n=1 Tax=Rubellicoccus peritrichatus TaxID=3080537 RepID=A0AAQ3LFH4_9BACT|nr:NTP transferase domain-containing protein [Puniceicoccus sp. CR14]WOO42895.1 NTP transferase domain-containing protein [Puniceicoccus sp. CR14]
MIETDVIAPKLYGLLVAGGRSRRMGQDKAALPAPNGQPLWRRTCNLLAASIEKTFLSVRPEQTLPGYNESDGVLIEDTIDNAGPLGGILSAFAKHSDAAWLVVACDLPLLDKETLDYLIQNRNTEGYGTTYKSAFDSLPEPLCAIYEPSAASVLKERLNAQKYCPRRFLVDETEQVRLLTLPNQHALENANTPEDLKRIEAIANQ